MSDQSGSAGSMLVEVLARPHRRLVLDVGCGDGRATARLAKSDPEALVIGVDANLDSATRMVQRAGRGAARGGLPNLAFVRAAADALPAELDGRADEVRVEYPWGSLLAGLLAGEPGIAGGLRRVLRRGGAIRVVLNARGAPEDAGERLGAALVAAGFVEVRVERTAVAAETGWSKRLAAGRSLGVWIAEARAGSSDAGQLDGGEAPSPIGAPRDARTAAERPPRCR